MRIPPPVFYTLLFNFHALCNSLCFFQHFLIFRELFFRDCKFGFCINTFKCLFSYLLQSSCLYFYVFQLFVSFECCLVNSGYFKFSSAYRYRIWYLDTFCRFLFCPSYGDGSLSREICLCYFINKAANRKGFAF